jgi:hypothetical protein
MKHKKKLVAVAIIVSVAVIIYVSVRKSQSTRIERLRDLDSNKRYKTLKDLHHFLMRVAFLSQTEPFIMYGTLLGYVREKDIICWDFDLDYGIHETQYETLYDAVKVAIHEYPQFKVVTNFFESPFFHIRMFKVEDLETGLNLDVVSMKESIQNGQRSMTREYPRFLLTYYWKERQLDFPFKDLYPLQPISFLDCLTYIPSNPDVWLRSWYGSNYLLPDRSCNCQRCKTKANKKEVKNEEVEETE